VEFFAAFFVLFFAVPGRRAALAVFFVTRRWAFFLLADLLAGLEDRPAPWALLADLLFFTVALFLADAAFLDAAALL